MIKYLLNLIFPPKCIFCGSFLGIDTEMDVCESCYENVPFTDDSSEIFTASNSFCDDYVCVCEYSGIIRESLRKFKFQNKPYYGRTFGKILAEKVKKVTEYRNFDIIISVPLHKDKQRIRGYNQSLIISRLVSRETGIPEASGFLKRIRNTDSQSRLSRQERAVNIRDAFRVNRAELIKGKAVLLIDDILTTGSTLDECCKVLKDAGARCVVAAVVASGRKSFIHN